MAVVSSAPFDDSAWSRLLAEVVTPEGKVDYDRLLQLRPVLQRFLDELAAVSPDSAPERFADSSAALAYWLNAYNAFVLAGVIAEYPIRSVWKTRDCRFFQQQRHVAGGRALSLDEVEHEILRGRFREPRIHFAINCASNGCPPLRPSAWDAGDLAAALSEATTRFLGSEWNCRIDREEGRIYVSRLFKMYAEDFAGEAGSTADYRRGVLEFVSRHTGVSAAELEPLELVYNTYDWGLNDARREPQIRPITFHESVETFHDGDGSLRELLLYDGNFCNRDCSWCTVFGSPHGWYREYGDDILRSAARHVADDGNVKFYGGEPTLHAASLIAAMRRLRELGFRGLFTIYSNGVQAARLIEMLESDPRSEAVLNYSIYRGRDAEPLPDHARERLEAWSLAHPMRLFSGYKALYRTGAGAGEGAEAGFAADRRSEYHGHDGGCLLCFPVLRSDGRFHACPFAIENDAPHFALGDLATPPGDLVARYRSFRQWAVGILDPEARRRGLSSCEVCARHVRDLATPADSVASGAAALAGGSPSNA